MSSRTKGMPSPGSDCTIHPGIPSDNAADRLASLAALTMTRQQPGIVLPALAGIPTSYSYTQGSDTALLLARSLVALGLGTAKLWTSLNGNISLFIRNSLNEWLKTIGVVTLRNHVSFDFAIVDDLDVASSERLAANKGKLLILLETSDNCGFITIGDQVDLLEKLQKGLGVAFYETLRRSLCTWMRPYDVTDAEAFAERWKESIEMDMETGTGDGDDTDEEMSFEEYCRTRDIDFPDVEAAKPACLRDGTRRQKSSSRTRHLSLLKQHRHGVYSAWIEPVLAMAAVRHPGREESNALRAQLEDCWEDSPLPNWIVAFRDHDPITQAFDEESQTVYECSHAPTWLDSFDPSDVADVRRVLTYVQRFVEVNVNLVKLSKAIEKGSSHGSTNRSEFDDELRAA